MYSQLVPLPTLSVAELSAQLTLIIGSFAAEKRLKEAVKFAGTAKEEFKRFWQEEGAVKMAEEAMWRLTLCIHLVWFPTKIPSSR
jgi:hypothetical protein